MLLYELEIPFTQRADKQNLSLLCTTSCSFKRRRPCTYKSRSLFWIHRGRRHPEQPHGGPELSCVNTTSDLFEIENS